MTGFLRWPKAFHGARKVHALLKRVPVLSSFVLRGERALLSWMERQRGFRTYPFDPISLRLSLLLGSYEGETVAYMRSTLRPGMVVVDVGAHVGYFSRLAGELVAPGGRVVALEPNPATFCLLRENVSRLEGVLPLNLAVAGREGFFPLALPEVSSGVAHLDLAKSPEGPGARPVLALPLERVLEGLGLDRVDLLKVDVEGMEVEVLRSLGGKAPAVNRLLLEFLPPNLRRFGTGGVELVDLLFRLGFRRFRFLDPLDENWQGNVPPSLSGYMGPWLDPQGVREAALALGENPPLGILNLLALREGLPD